MDLPRFSLGKVAPSAGALRERKALRVQESRDSPTPHPRPLKRRPGSQRWQRTGTLGRGSVLEDIIEGEKERTVEERRGGEEEEGGSRRRRDRKWGRGADQVALLRSAKGRRKALLCGGPPPRHREEGLAGQGKGEPRGAAGSVGGGEHPGGRKGETLRAQPG